MKTATRDFSVAADEAAVERAAAALQRNGINAMTADNADQARRMIAGMIPEGAEVMTMTSVTLETLGLTAELNDSGRYFSLRNRLNDMHLPSQESEKRRLGAAPEWALGSVHAVTEEGQLMIASMTGSQLPAYAYGAARVVCVIGAQKVVRDIAEGMRRIEEYAYPLEDQRAMKAYGTHSGVNKVLIVNREVAPGRLTAILVKQALGY